LPDIYYVHAGDELVASEPRANIILFKVKLVMEEDYLLIYYLVNLSNLP
jgi:hypothetical protein